MNGRVIAADALRTFVEQILRAAGYDEDEAIEAADVLLWASLRGVDTHGVRNLKSYYVDRTRSGQLRPGAALRIEYDTQLSARIDGGSGLGLSTAHRAMRLAIEKAHRHGIGVVGVRNTHHLGPAGYFAHLAVEQGLLGACTTGHFFGDGYLVGIAPLGAAAAMFSTNPLSFAAPCGRHPPFVLDMSSAVATVNRIEMRGQLGQPIPVGWASDAAGAPTTDAAAARLLWPLGGTTELGGHKGAGLAMMASVLSGVLTSAWSPVASPAAASIATESRAYDQPTMSHFFAAMQIELFQPRAAFEAAMAAMIDALHGAPALQGCPRLQYPGEPEHTTMLVRLHGGIPVADHVLADFRSMAEDFSLTLPEMHAAPPT